MATNFSPCKGSYGLNQFPSNVMFGMNGFHVSASGAIQGHHGPLVLLAFQDGATRILQNHLRSTNEQPDVLTPRNTASPTTPQNRSRPPSRSGSFLSPH